jgi:hypothetical protein
MPEQNKGRLPIKWLQGQSNYNMSRFEVVEPTRPFGHGSSNHFNISSVDEKLERGSPSLVERYLGKVSFYREPQKGRGQGFESRRAHFRQYCVSKLKVLLSNL